MSKYEELKKRHAEVTDCCFTHHQLLSKEGTLVFRNGDRQLVIDVHPSVDAKFSELIYDSYNAYASESAELANKLQAIDALLS